MEIREIKSKLCRKIVKVILKTLAILTKHLFYIF